MYAIWRGLSQGGFNLLNLRGFNPTGFDLMWHWSLWGFILGRVILGWSFLGWTQVHVCAFLDASIVVDLYMSTVLYTVHCTCMYMYSVQCTYIHACTVLYCSTTVCTPTCILRREYSHHCLLPVVLEAHYVASTLIWAFSQHIYAFNNNNNNWLNKDARAVTNWCIHNLTQTLR